MILQIHLIILLLLSNLFSLGSAQTNEGRIMGRISDYEGNAVAGATVFVTGPTSKAVLTNAQGYYVFLAVPEGKYNLKVFKRGMPRLKTNTVFVRPKITLRKDFTFITEKQQEILLAKQEAENKHKESEQKQKLAEKPILVAQQTEEEKLAIKDPSIKPKPDKTEQPKIVSVSNEPSTEIKTLETINTDAITDIGLKAAAKEAEEAEKLAFATTEKQVEIEGGIASVIKQINYPEVAKKLKIEGLVVARVYVDEKGYLTRIDLLKQAHELLDEEAVRVLSEKTSFQPAERDGKKVSGALTVPIKFKIAKVVW